SGQHATFEDRAGELPVRKRHHTRVHQEQRFGCDAGLLGEQTERIAAAQDDRAELVATAADRLREDLPLARLALAADREDAAGESSTGTLANTSAMTVVAARSLRRACGCRISRCESVGPASCFTSSGRTKSRPWMSAYACEARASASDPRGDAPRYTSGCERLAFTTPTT